jgi:hypothetical protein
MMRIGDRTGAGIRLKVYGIRVVRTETAVHIVCGAAPRDPDAPPCTCTFCLGDDWMQRRWKWC